MCSIKKKKLFAGKILGNSMLVVTAGYESNQKKVIALWEFSKKILFFMKSIYTVNRHGDIIIEIVFVRLC